MSKQNNQSMPPFMQLMFSTKALMVVVVLVVSYLIFNKPQGNSELVINLPGKQTAYSKAKDGSSQNSSYSYLDLTQAQSRVMLVKSGKTIEVLSKADMVSQSLSPSGRYIGIITLKRDNICRSFIYDLKSGRETEVAICSALNGSTLSWSDDDTLYFIAQKGQTSAIQSYNPNSKTAVEFYQAEHIAFPTKLPSPNLLAFMQYDNKGASTLMVLDEAGNKRSIYSSSTAKRYCVHQARFVLLANDNASAHIQVIDFAGNELKNAQLPQPLLDPYCAEDALYFTAAVDANNTLIRRLQW